MAKMKIMAVCEAVLKASADYKAGKRKSKYVVNGVRFDLSERGLCQRNVRKGYEAATGNGMPGAACCAGRTFKNLKAMPKSLFAWRDALAKPWAQVVGKLEPGDFLYFSGGRACGTCGREVGHVGIWMGTHEGAEWMFQNTVRDQLGTTREGPTTSQKARFLGAFRFAGVQ